MICCELIYSDWHLGSMNNTTVLTLSTFQFSLVEKRIHHMDLYRLSEGTPEDLAPLNLDFVLNQCKILEQGVSLISTKVIPSPFLVYPSCTQSKPGTLNHLFCLFTGISLIEWSSRLGTMMPSERLEITFKIDPDTMEEEENTRYLTLTPHGERWIKRIETIKEEGYLDDLIVEYEEE
jgi:tRNA A37 threonylcarbamoyladenosine biosynthesis protein TsaE